MRFLVRKGRFERYFNSKNYIYRLIVRLLIVLAIAYSLGCIWLFLRQEEILYQPNHNIAPSSPSDPDFQLTYQNVWIDVSNSAAQIHGWWFDVPAVAKPVIAIPNEPVNILATPKTMLYFCGRGGSKTHYNNLARIKGFQQLGFSVLAIDYRGYGLS